MATDGYLATAKSPYPSIYIITWCTHTADRDTQQVSAFLAEKCHILTVELYLAFPAHGKAGPGLITVTSSTLYFTPLISASAIITIPFSDLRGIKKTGILKGLSIRWTETEGASTEKEEKFMWVGDRDELFARLIGPGGRRWLKV